MRYALFVLLACAGCTLSVPNTPTDDTVHQPDPVVVKPTSADIWAALANYVGRRVITTPQDLARYVKALSDAGDLTSADLTAFDAAFPGAPSDERTLDAAADAAKIKGIK
jgi:hypothetical protein